MQAVVLARLIFCAEVRVFCFVEQEVFHELLFDFVFGVCFFYRCIYCILSVLLCVCEVLCKAS